MVIYHYDRQFELVDHLGQLGINLATLESALAYGDAEARSYSRGAPRSAPGVARWLRTTEGVHDGLMAQPDYWERSDPMNLPTWVNHERGVQLVVSSGDGNTGVRGFVNPSTRNPKGPSFGKLVEANEQTKLFDAVSHTGELLAGQDTWVFLYHAREGKIFSEVSLPIEMSGQFIRDWKHRILLAPFVPGSGTFEPASTGPEPAQDFSFKINRK